MRKTRHKISNHELYKLLFLQKLPPVYSLHPQRAICFLITYSSTQSYQCTMSLSTCTADDLVISIADIRFLFKVVARVWPHRCWPAMILHFAAIISATCSH